MGSNRANRNHRTPLWIGVSLLALTIGIGAARIAPGTSGGGGDGSKLPLHFGAPAGGGVGFSGQLDKTAVLAGSDGLVRIELAIRGEDRAAEGPVQMPSDIVVVLDQSGSMAGEKIADARAAIRELISALGPEDRFALVSYSVGAHRTIPSRGSAERRGRAGARSSIGSPSAAAPTSPADSSWVSRSWTGAGSGGEPRA